jgi:hypothetical protein
MFHLELETDRRHVLHAYRCRVQAQLGWWDGSGIVPALIKKISRCGATLETEQPPPEASALWVRIDGGPTSEWIEARIIAVEALTGFPWIGRKSYQIQVMFPGIPSDQLFRTLFDDVARSLPESPDLTQAISARMAPSVHVPTASRDRKPGVDKHSLTN